MESKVGESNFLIVTVSFLSLNVSVNALADFLPATHKVISSLRY